MADPKPELGSRTSRDLQKEAAQALVKEPGGAWKVLLLLYLGGMSWAIVPSFTRFLDAVTANILEGKTNVVLDFVWWPAFGAFLLGYLLGWAGCFLIRK